VTADRSLGDDALTDIYDAADRALDDHDGRYPGPREGRQPVHTVYVPADRFTAATVAEHGAEALRLLAAHAPDGPALAGATGLALEAELAETVRRRVAAKLEREPVEDLRIDFEDGYGVRGDEAEDTHAEAAGTVVGCGQAGAPFVGLRVKSFADGLTRRSLRTLDCFLTALLAETGGSLPPGLRITFPKIVTPAHVAGFSDALGRLERRLDLDEGALSFEVQIETTQSVLAPDGRAALPSLIDAAGGRLDAAHIGVFDYSAALGLPPGEQRLDHPALDFARHVTQVAAAGTGLWLSDGSTNLVPGADTAEQVHAVWRRHAGHVVHSLRHGWEQGWDLHPAHLVSRYAAVYAFLLDGLDDALARLGRWPAQEAAGGVLDEPATIRTLTRQVRRAVACGAIDAGEAAERSGLETLAPGR
jgi:citrate lyase beta subunit